MQLKRSIITVTFAGLAYWAQQRTMAISWQQAWGWGPFFHNSLLVLWAAFSLVLSMGTIMQLGGNLFSSELGPGGMPAGDDMSERSQQIIALVITAMFLLTYTYPQALWVIDLIFFMLIIIRLIQWNGFEPNGLQEFESTKG